MTRTERDAPPMATDAAAEAAAEVAEVAARWPAVEGALGALFDRVTEGELSIGKGTAPASVLVGCFGGGPLHGALSRVCTGQMVLNTPPTGSAL